MSIKTVICYFAIFFISLTTNAYAGHNFYHGGKLKDKNFQWNQRTTKHFTVMYKDRYFDPEGVLERLTAKFDIRPIIAGIKIKLFINEGPAYTIVGAKTIYARDEKSLAHELTHVLFLQLNPNAPMSIREGVAVYAEFQEEPHAPGVDISEIIALEKNYSKISRMSTGAATYGRRAKRNIESQFYAKGFCFVTNIIRESGIQAFKEFYKECSTSQGIQRAWDKIHQR